MKPFRCYHRYTHSRLYLDKMNNVFIKGQNFEDQKIFKSRIDTCSIKKFPKQQRIMYVLTPDRRVTVNACELCEEFVRSTSVLHTVSGLFLQTELPQQNVIEIGMVPTFNILRAQKLLLYKHWQICWPKRRFVHANYAPRIIAGDRRRKAETEDVEATLVL